ncbi:TRAP transporter substrate-binding protein [Pelagerythrobacter marinus]|uniref:TRAP transporter substrate-binding protein n=1 Tax=Pelagerythrobacter marinus TaxID=538382 RepID=UPI002037186F|nr:TRAP transporter substrate-binding protein [Pelagerythrobacter marinus]USA39413.1 TRAP transporter substrate-binding protein [Pelagerythrobacter marinus]WPZ06447.1 TRAP transporter substrate-binding protein [Pelagerythrobacter marinus]
MSGLLTGADAHPADYPTVKAVEFMGRYLSERTGGRLGIKVYAGGQLGSETDTLEITSFGGLDLNRVNFAPLNSIEPMTLPFSLPFVFESVPHMRRVVDSEVGDEVLAAMKPHGLIGLCIYDSGARSFYNTRRAIRTPDDMAGLKLRVPASDLYVAMINALGANAVPIPFGEVYQSLAQGVIDGAENNWPSFVSARHYEVASHLSLTEHLLTPEALVMSKASWDRLSPGDRDLVREAARLSVTEMRRLWDRRVTEAKATIAASSVAVNEVEKEPFAALMRPVWEEFITTPRQKSIVERILAMREG